MSYSFNNLILNNLDSAGTLNIGTNTASAITFGKTGVITTFPGPIASVEPISFNDIDTTAANTMFIGKAIATKVEIGKAAITTEIKGKLSIKDNIDTSSATILTIGGVASALTITPNTTVAGTLTVQPPSSNLHATTKVYVDTLVTGSGGSSEGTLNNVELTQKGGIDPADYYNQSVYVQKNKNIVSLYFAGVPSINVDTNTNPIVSIFILPATNIVPDTNTGSGTFILCGTNQAYAKILYDATASNIKLIITPTTAFGATTTTIEPFHLEYKANNDTAITNGSWGTIAPTVVISNPLTDNLIIGETATITFTISESVADFNLDATITANKGTLSAFNAVSGTTYTATFTPNTPSEGTYEIKVLPNSFSFNSVFNKFETILLKGIDTLNPSITSMTPASPNIASGTTTTISLLFSEPMDNSVLTNLNDNVNPKVAVTPADAGIGAWATADNTTYTCTFTSGATNGTATIQITNLSVKDASGNITTKTQALTQGLNIGISALTEFTSVGKTLGSITSLAGTNGVTLDGFNQKDASAGDVSVVSDPDLIAGGVPVFNFNDAYLYNSTAIANAKYPDEYWTICLMNTHNIANGTISNYATMYDDGWLSNTVDAYKYSFAFRNTGGSGIGGYYRYGANGGIVNSSTQSTSGVFPTDKWVFNVSKILRGSGQPRFKMAYDGILSNDALFANSNTTIGNSDALTGSGKQLVLGSYANTDSSGGTVSLANDAPAKLWASNQRIAYFGIFDISTSEPELDTKITAIKASFGITW
jgi:hypothetical protein